jgi:hypothetical protein
MSSEDKWYISGPLAIGTSEPMGQLTVEGIAQPNQGRLTFFSASADVEYDGGKDGVFVFRNTAPNGKTAFVGGNHGIGTDDPTHPLHVKTNWGFLALDTNAAGQDSGIRLMEGGAVKWHIYNSALAKKLFIDRDGLHGSLTIDGSGNVGIGTPDPTHPLHVKTNWGFLALDTNAAGQDSGIRLMEGGAVKWHIYNSASAKKLFVDRDGLHGSVTIDQSGNVGIGTTDPRKGKLVVDGGKLAVNSGNLTTWPPGWGDGIHTWDLYGEGTVGAGKNGKVNTYLSSDGNGYFSGKLTVEGDLTIGSAKTISSPGRLHISGDADLYLLNKGGVVVSRAWGGNGSLEIDGALITHPISADQAKSILADKADGTAVVASAGGVSESRVDFYYKYKGEVHLAKLFGGHIG